MKSDTRKFTWNDSELSNHEAAYTQMSEIAEEHEIEVFFSGGEQFADRIDSYGMDYKDFTVGDFAKWKAKVVDKVLTALVEAERSAFLEMMNERKEGGE